MTQYEPTDAARFRSKPGTLSEKLADEFKRIQAGIGDGPIVRPIPIGDIQYITDTPEAIVFSKSIETPGQSVYISANTRLSSANNGLSVYTLASGELFFLTGQKISDSGTEKPFDYNAGPLVEYSIQDLSDETSAGTDITFSHTVVSNTVLQKVKLVPAEVGELTLKILDGGNDAEIAEMITTITTPDVENVITLQDGAGNPTPLIFPNGENLKIISSGVALKGHTNGSFYPYVKIDRNVYNPVELSGGGVVTSEKFTDLTDTPVNKNVPEIQNVVVNPFSQLIEYKQAALSDNSDIQISVPSDGEILEYDAGISKWINNEPRNRAVLASFNTIDTFDDWQDSDISYLFANDENIIDQVTPLSSKEGDMIIVYNYNKMPLKVVNINARVGETINSEASYEVPLETMVFFVKKVNDWKFGGSGSIGGNSFDLSTHSVTELNDVTSAGSGKIITDDERTHLENIINGTIDGGDPNSAGPGLVDGGTV